MKKMVIFLILIASYVMLFIYQGHIKPKEGLELTPLLPAGLQQATLGFLRQLTAEIYVVNAAVFLGGVKDRKELQDNAPILTQYFQVASSLHPDFVDTYFFCQSAIPHINPRYAELSNQILDRGIEALSDNWVLPMFAGYNAMHYLKDPDKAATYLHVSSLRSKAPLWVGHLATVLSASAGRIKRAAEWLDEILRKEKDDSPYKKLFQLELSDLQKALEVKKALERYRASHGTYPSILKELVPEQLPKIPVLRSGYQISWSSTGGLRLIKKKRKQLKKFKDSQKT